MYATSFIESHTLIVQTILPRSSGIPSTKHTPHQEVGDVPVMICKLCNEDIVIQAVSQPSSAYFGCSLIMKETKKVMKFIIINFQIYPLASIQKWLRPETPSEIFSNTCTVALRKKNPLDSANFIPRPLSPTMLGFNFQVRNIPSHILK